MKISIQALHLELSNDVKRLVEEKIGSLDKFAKDLVMEASIDLEKTTEHHNKGDVFRVSASLKVPEKSIFVETSSESIPSAIDDIKDQLQREIKKYKEKKQSVNRKEAAAFKDRRHEMESVTTEE